MSLKMAHKVIVPQKKIMSRSFLNSGTLIVNIRCGQQDLYLKRQSQKTGLPYSFMFHREERLPPAGIEHSKKENKYFPSVHYTPEAEFMNVYFVAVSGHNLEGSQS